MMTTIHPPSPHGTLDRNRLSELLQQYDYPENDTMYYSYGTAGFRYLAEVLPPIMVRVAVCAFVLGTTSTGGEAVTTSTSSFLPSIGVMITASHNTEEYNGIKFAGRDGGMIEEEELAERIVNMRNQDEILNLVLARQESSSQLRLRVHVARDTRAHSETLHDILIETLGTFGTITVVDHGIVSTPVLHANVLFENALQGGLHPIIPFMPRPYHLNGYLYHLASNYVALLQTKDDIEEEEPQPQETTFCLVDCACGVGYLMMEKLNPILQELILTTTQPPRFVLVNAPGSGPLNVECGSEHVQKSQQSPRLYDYNTPEQDPKNNIPYAASFDGDADRIVFWKQQSNGHNDDETTFQLLDGDKISVLLGEFVQAQIETIQSELVGPPIPSLSLGVVQTAYANGASTHYLQQNRVTTRIAKTGVKHLHECAKEFDIGIYFEANGHGTILFGNAYYNFLHTVQQQQYTLSAKAQKAWMRLSILPNLVNPAVGDALADLLLVDSILQLTNSDLSSWGARYTDWPSKQSKVRVPDRTAIRTNDNETRCIQPPALQTAIDAAVNRYDPQHNARAFVRPSGTEDVVRVYAEASTVESANALAKEVEGIVQSICG
jgi:phosphoacetylglucosamine mutase